MKKFSIANKKYPRFVTDDYKNVKQAKGDNSPVQIINTLDW